MSINNIIVLNEKVLIEPCSEMRTTNAGLYLPPESKTEQKETIDCGRVIKVGNGYPVFNNSEGNIWENASKGIIQFVPLQVKVKDLVFYLASQAVEFLYETKKYVIVPECCILLIDRNSQVKDEISKLIGE